MYLLAPPGAPVFIMIFKHCSHNADNASDILHKICCTMLFANVFIFPVLVPNNQSYKMSQI